MQPMPGASRSVSRNAGLIVAICVLIQGGNLQAQTNPQANLTNPLTYFG